MSETNRREFLFGVCAAGVGFAALPGSADIQNDDLGHRCKFIDLRTQSLKATWTTDIPQWWELMESVGRINSNFVDGRHPGSLLFLRCGSMRKFVRDGCGYKFVEMCQEMQAHLRYRPDGWNRCLVLQGWKDVPLYESCPFVFPTGTIFAEVKP